jgi:thioredoxin 2
MADPIVPCPSCSAKNRLKAPPKGQVPVCGRCGATLPWLVSTSDDAFAADLDTTLLVLADFWAPWCGPCRMVAPVLGDLSKELAGKLKVVKLNVDDNPQTARRYGVQGIPLLVLFKDGREVDRVVGAVPKSTLTARLQPHLN